MRFANIPGLPGGSVFADEVGIEIGRYGGFHLKTIYQPLFRVSQTELMPAGIEGFVQPQIDFEPVAAEVFLASVTPEMQSPVKSLCRALQIGNYHYVGADNLSLHLNCDTGLRHNRDNAFAQVEAMAQRVADVELDPHLVVCGFAARDVGQEDVPGNLVGAMRSSGFQIAVDDFGPGHSVLDRIERIRPDIVKIDGAWFRRIAEIPTAVRLLERLVAGLRQEGLEVLVKGIETVDQMRIAIAVGANLVQGYLLARPFKAGALYDFRPLEIERYFRDRDRVVVPLRSNDKGS